MTKKNYIILISISIIVIIVLSVLVYIKDKDNKEEVINNPEFLEYSETFMIELSGDKSYYIIKDVKRKHQNDLVLSIPNTIDSIPVKKIVDDADKNFDGFKNIEKIIIPANVEYIGTSMDDDGVLNNGTLGDSFLTATNTKTYHIEVNPQNKVYASKNGVLYNKDFTTLITYPCGLGRSLTLNYKVIDSVTTLYSKAFYGNPYLNAIDLNNVETIGNSTFERNTNLRNVKMLKVKDIKWKSFYDSAIQKIDLCNTVTAIESLAFGNCEELSNIFIPSSNIEFGERVFINTSSQFAIYTTAESIEALKTIESLKNYEILIE